MWRQGSQVSMRMARGSVSLLSSHGRGIRPQDTLHRGPRGPGTRCETAPSWLLVSHHSPWNPQEVVVTPTLTSEGSI